MQFYLWSIPATLVLLTLGVVGQFFEVVAALQQVPGAILGPLIWYRYLTKSKRVRVTYVGTERPGLSPAHAGLVAAVIGTLVLFANTAIYSSQDVWTTYSSEVAGYSVDAPGLARPSTSTENGITSYTVEFGNDFRGFAVSTYELLDPFGIDPQQLLLDTQNLVLKNLSGRLFSSDPIPLGTNPGLHFTGRFVVDNATGELYGRAYIIDDTQVFILLATGSPGGRMRAEADRFLSSFRLTGGLN